MEFPVDGDIGLSDTRVETATYRVAQEALSNASRHVDAASLTLKVYIEGEHSAGKPTLRLADDSRGYDVMSVRKPAQEGMSMGLLGMEERVRLGDGTFGEESAPAPRCADYG